MWPKRGVRQLCGRSLEEKKGWEKDAWTCEQRARGISCNCALGGGAGRIVIWNVRACVGDSFVRNGGMCGTYGG